MYLPFCTQRLIERIADAGYIGYIVGGAVRDFIMGREVTDYDVTVNTTPENIMDIFSDCTIIPTGIRYGTVTVIFEGHEYEITSHRKDGNYIDFRRPESITYSDNIVDDLARRDFTINAIAYNPHIGYVDPFDGRGDIARKIIKTVGNPKERFSEDGLRIMRALRFSSQLGFSLDEITEKVMIEEKDLLMHISSERYRDELLKLIIGNNFSEILYKYHDIIAVKIPILRTLVGFLQHNPYHAYDVWEHTIKAMENVPADKVLRMTMLLHDIAKPATFSLDDKGIGHFYAHAPKGSVIAADILKELNFPKQTIRRICLLIRYHYIPSNISRRGLRLLMGRVGEDNLRTLLLLREADNAAKSQAQAHNFADTKALSNIVEDIIASGECYRIKDMDINGDDIAKLGVPVSPIIGKILRALLDEIVDDRLENNYASLIDRAKQLWRDMD